MEWEDIEKLVEFSWEGRMDDQQIPVKKANLARAYLVDETIMSILQHRKLFKPDQKGRWI